jgi:ribosome-binding factor A
MSIRTDKVSELIKKEISMILLKEMNDPTLGFVTITSVKISPDLKYAKIYISVFNKDLRENTLEHLNNAKGFVRTKLASRLHIKHTPELEFFIDDTMDYVENIENLIREIHKNDNQTDA